MYQDWVAELGLPAIWLSFAVCVAVIVRAGTRLAKYGDVIAIKTGMGGTWIGVFLLAGVTSLPELITGLSSVVVVGQPDLAVGGVLGSCVYNLLIIAILDFVYTKGPIYNKMTEGHGVSAGFGIVMLGAVAAMMLFQQVFGPLSIGPIGPFTIIGPLLYLVAIKGVFTSERRTRELFGSEMARSPDDLSSKSRLLPMSQVYARYTVYSVVIVLTALALPVVSEALAMSMEWDESFVGTIFLALGTSLPEVIISVHAVRIGAIDLAIGNVLGSNLFDLVTLPVVDAAYLDGPLLAAASGGHMFTTLAAITMTGIAGIALSYRPRTKVLRAVSWFSIALVVVALLNGGILFIFG